MEILEKRYRIKWEIEGYYITECNKVFNRKTGREMKQAMVNYTIGYYLHSRFRSLIWIRRNCKKIEKIKLPF